MKRIGIDVGGTFTDVVVLDEATGTTRCFKAATDYGRPADGIMHAFDNAGVDGADVSHVKLGTTLGLNALLTRTGARTGLLTTAGFRDVLQIRRTHRERLYDLDERIPEPLVPRRLRKEVIERIGSGGEVVVDLDPESVRAAWRELRSEGVTSVAIAFLFSFKNPDHERRARDVIVAEGGAETIFLSSDVLPVLREYERTSTTVTAAYVAPVLGDFVAEISGRLGRRGVRDGRLSVITNSGGSLAAEVSARAPIPTLLSGPAGGVSGARWLAGQVGMADVLTLDMGGTSCDVSGIQAGVPDERLDMRLGGLDVAYPTFDIHTIGAGGGSIAWIDGGGALRVGPASAGSTPGPACYGRGGALPTVTDANLVLGRYDESIPLGGSLHLDRAAAERAIEEHIARPLGLSVGRAAAGILRLVNANMVNAVRAISIERGRDPRRCALVPFGGGGPVHALDIAQELDVTTVIVPPFPGCLSAFGAALSQPRRDALRSVNRGLDDVEPAEIARLVTRLSDEVRSLLRDEGYDEDSTGTEVWVNLHYRGQAHELSIRHHGPAVTADSLARLGRDFTAAHARQYGHSFEDVPVEIVTVRVTGYGPREDVPVTWDWSAAGPGGPLRRPVYFDGAGGEDGFVDTDVRDRSALRTGDVVHGPAVVHQADATTLVPPGWRATCHPSGSLLVTDERNATAS
ncbi:methylhydantoinase [Sphaerisporangium rufum]|uniref:Methylhydantoinase n=1 Tax=Sphaerisporangium rufum TaxID=1381558 RepID=A0A919R2P9_9ACTN|nr:hydantoinase/oxoprolinase family protein [Sphaerisporangium rufum]GII78499.1 methylhydantoinase [Sphaerisporangium rufum]